MRRGLLAAAALCIAFAVFALRPHPTPGPFLRDFEAYWSAGATWNAHADPYGRAIWDAERTIAGVDANRAELLPFVGPPPSLLMWSALARLPYATAAALWACVLGVALAALVAGVTLAGGAPRAFSILGGLALALACGPVTSDLALGQLALPAFAAATFAMLLAARSLTGATLAACIAFTQPNAAAGLSSQLGRNRETLAVVLGALAFYALGALLAGPGWPVDYARIAAAHLAAERFDAIQLTPASIAFGFGAGAWQANLAGIAFASCAIAAAIALYVSVRDRFACFAAFSALMPLAAAFVHEHDLVTAYAAALWCALRTRGTTRVLALAATLLLCVDWLGLAQRPSGIPQSALLALAALASFAALGRADELRGAAIVAPAFAALFIFMAWLAGQHPVPIWPDAMQSFHVPVAGSAAAIWSREQRAAGLFAAVPAWALLRSLSLLGCALLAYAIYRHRAYYRTA